MSLVEVTESVTERSCNYVFVASYVVAAQCTLMFFNNNESL